MTGDFRPRPIQIDVGSLVERSVTSLYSHLVTRPTGRAVRLAIETQLADAGDTAFSLIDLSEVTILDFSCADEVVAKLLLRYLEDDRPRNAYFVFRGVRDLHRDTMEVALRRQGLAAVAQREDGVFELLGAHTEGEARVWRVVEENGRVAEEVVRDVLDPAERAIQALKSLVERRLVFKIPESGDVFALSRLVRDLV